MTLLRVLLTSLALSLVLAGTVFGGLLALSFVLAGTALPVLLVTAPTLLA